MIQTKIVFYSPSKNIIAISPHVVVRRRITISPHVVVRRIITISPPLVVRKEQPKQSKNVLLSKTKSY